MNPYKLIFLDIDGVLNHHNYYHARHRLIKAGFYTHRDFRDEYGDFFCPNAVANLSKLIEETEAKIVVSSTWRLSGEEIMKELWQFRNLPGEIVGVTPHFRWAEQQRSIPRGLEIESWLQKNVEGFHYYQYTSPKIEEWKRACPLKAHVILDDDSDMMYYQRKHFVKTSQKSGLNLACLKRAIKVLNG